MRRIFLAAAITIIAFILPLTVMACDGAGPNKHVGLITAVDSSKKTFTIKDAETQSPITFMASEDIIKELKNVKSRVMVSYEEDVTGDLKAVGVTF